MISKTEKFIRTIHNKILVVEELLQEIKDVYPIINNEGYRFNSTNKELLILLDNEISSLNNNDDLWVPDKVGLKEVIRNVHSKLKQSFEIYNQRITSLDNSLKFGNEASNLRENNHIIIWLKDNDSISKLVENLVVKEQLSKNDKNSFINKFDLPNSILESILDDYNTSKIEWIGLLKDFIRFFFELSNNGFITKDFFNPGKNGFELLAKNFSVKNCKPLTGHRLNVALEKENLKNKDPFIESILSVIKPFQ